jgi:hypothetical protein
MEIVREHQQQLDLVLQKHVILKVPQIHQPIQQILNVKLFKKPVKQLVWAVLLLLQHHVQAIPQQLLMDQIA